MKKKALDNINFKTRKWIIGYFGPNGAGKVS